MCNLPNTALSNLLTPAPNNLLTPTPNNLLTLTPNNLLLTSIPNNLLLEKPLVIYSLFRFCICIFHIVIGCCFNKYYSLLTPTPNNLFDGVAPHRTADPEGVPHQCPLGADRPNYGPPVNV